MSGFVLDISVPYLVPSTVDRGPPDATSSQLLTSPLWNNIVLLLGFGLQHRYNSTYCLVIEVLQLMLLSAYIKDHLLSRLCESVFIVACCDVLSSGWHYSYSRKKALEFSTWL